MTLTFKQAQALVKVCDAIVDSVRLAGSTGAPAGVMYAALMAQGCTLNQFNSLTGSLCRIGRLERRGDLFFIPERAPSAPSAPSAAEAHRIAADATI